MPIICLPNNTKEHVVEQQMICLDKKNLLHKIVRIHFYTAFCRKKSYDMPNTRLRNLTRTEAHHMSDILLSINQEN